MEDVADSIGGCRCGGRGAGSEQSWERMAVGVVGCGGLVLVCGVAGMGWLRWDLRGGSWREVGVGGLLAASERGRDGVDGLSACG